MRESEIQSHFDGNSVNAEANMPQAINPRRLLRSKIWWLAVSAIRIAYRTLLRSSSLWEPRYPPLKIFFFFFVLISLCGLRRLGPRA